MDTEPTPPPPKPEPKPQAKSEPEPELPENKKLAQAEKELGNACYKKKDFSGELLIVSLTSFSLGNDTDDCGNLLCL